MFGQRNRCRAVVYGLPSIFPLGSELLAIGYVKRAPFKGPENLLRGHSRKSSAIALNHAPSYARHTDRSSRCKPSAAKGGGATRLTYNRPSPQCQLAMCDKIYTQVGQALPRWACIRASLSGASLRYCRVIRESSVFELRACFELSSDLSLIIYHKTRCLQ